MEQTNKTVGQKEFIDIVNTHFNGNLKDASFALKNIFNQQNTKNTLIK